MGHCHSFSEPTGQVACLTLVSFCFSFCCDCSDLDAFHFSFSSYPPNIRGSRLWRHKRSYRNWPSSAQGCTKYGHRVWWEGSMWFWRTWGESRMEQGGYNVAGAWVSQRSPSCKKWSPWYHQMIFGAPKNNTQSSSWRRYRWSRTTWRTWW